MRHIRITAMIVLAFTLFTSAADAQRRTSKKPAPKKPPITVVPPLDVRAAREKVDNQLANVNKFVEVLGPIAQGIETLDNSSRTKTLPKTSVDKNEANKQKVIAAIRNLKAGLSDLESDFRTKTALQKYLPNIQGITDLAGQSEDLAIAGKFVASKEPLRNVALKLTDTLKVMPQ